MLTSSDITVSGIGYKVVSRLSNTPVHRSFLVESNGRRFLLKVYRKATASAFDRQRAVLASCDVSHESLILPIESGEYQDERFLLRPWIEGESFDSFARRFRLNPKHPQDALEIGSSICGVIATLHHAGLAHGRLSNGNIFFPKGRGPIIADPFFGPEAEMNGGTRRDVYQLGLLLSRLYTRKAGLLVNDRILMELYRAKLPLALIRILWQAMSAEPSNRFADAGTLAKALEEVTLAEHQRTVHVRAIPARAELGEGVDRRLVAGLVAVSLLAALVWGGYNITRQRVQDEVIGDVTSVTAESPNKENRFQGLLALDDVPVKDWIEIRHRAHLWGEFLLNSSDSISPDELVVAKQRYRYWREINHLKFAVDGVHYVSFDLGQVEFPIKKNLAVQHAMDRLPTRHGWAWYGTSIQESRACQIQGNVLLLQSKAGERVRWTTNPNARQFEPGANGGAYTVEIGIDVQSSSDALEGIGLVAASATGHNITLGITPDRISFSGSVVAHRWSNPDLEFQIVRVAVFEGKAFIFVNGSLLGFRFTDSERDPLITHDRPYFSWGQGRIAGAASARISHIAFDTDGAFAP